MQTLYDFGLEIQKIREAIDSVEVKGVKNASLIVYAYDRCNDLIQTINEITELSEGQQNPPEEGQNGEDTLTVNFETDDTILEEEGEMNGESDSGTTS